MLQEEDASAELVMRALERAMACNPHVGLFLAVPGVFEEVVDVATLLQDIQHHHHQPHHPHDTQDQNATDISRALAYCIDQFGCWRDAGNDEVDVRNFVYETAIFEHYAALNNNGKDRTISPVKLVRATYGEFVSRLEEERKKNYDVPMAADAVADGS